MSTIITKAIIDKAKVDRTLNDFEPYDLTDAKQQGLELRVRPRGVMWYFRYKVAGASKRLKIAAVDLISIAEARQVASDASAVNRSGGIPDQAWMTKRLVELGKIEAAPEPLATLWTFDEGRTEYLAEVERTLAEATYVDYTQILDIKELAHLDDRQLQSITRQEIAEIIKKIHQSGRETHSDHVLRVLRPFFNFLGDDAQTRASGVQAGLLAGMRSPPRSNIDDDEDDEDHGTYVPELEEMASAILCARAGYEPTYACAIELLVWTVQRRRAIAGARMEAFKPLPDGKTALWSIPPASRKKRRKNGKIRRPHVIPLPEPIWKCVVAAAEAREDQESKFLFPAKSKSGHINVTTLTHYLSYLPGIKASPHDMRRGFATHGESLLDFGRSDTDALLDHERPSWNEVTHRSATPAASMTGIHYSLHDGTHRTWGIMNTWTSTLQAEMDRLMMERPNLYDPSWVVAQRKANKRIQKSQRNAYEPLMPIAAE